MNNRITIYLPDDLIKRLKEISKGNYGVSVSKIKSKPKHIKSLRRNYKHFAKE